MENKMKKTNFLKSNRLPSAMLVALFMISGSFASLKAEEASCPQICDFYTNCLPVIFSTDEYKAKLKKTRKKDMKSCLKTCKRKKGKDSIQSCYTGQASSLNSCKTFYFCAVKYFKK